MNAYRMQQPNNYILYPSKQTAKTYQTAPLQMAWTKDMALDSWVGLKAQNFPKQTEPVTQIVPVPGTHVCLLDHLTPHDTQVGGRALFCLQGVPFICLDQLHKRLRIALPSSHNGSKTLALTLAFSPQAGDLPPYKLSPHLIKTRKLSLTGPLPMILVADGLTGLGWLGLEVYNDYEIRRFYPPA
ncbi:hypothetical protein K491DRAFT_25091 [Lophiostoma macrostomum CBS 122681]|uniref:Uncharacterized protein n=1 Tax=Lophiostoma macrostomum CBS 122681 TaxID=1314788 RepID=A0A6A6SYW2_9PLEO|nr:hypothetical protein K491DRAFT_25091 [Lophiostoma macrostomum CBS 122681]